MDLKAFVQSEVAIYVGSCDGDLNPEVTRAWGAVLLGDGSVSLCLDRDPSARTLVNLESNGAIAVTFASPVDYRSVQMKGVFLESGAPSDEDIARVEAHRNLFLAATERLGVPTNVVRALWQTDVVKVRFQPEATFNQTPGLGAGAPL